MDQTLEGLLADVRKIAVRVCDKPDSRLDLYQAFQKLCHTYLDASPEARSGIRKFLQAVRGGIEMPRLAAVIPHALYGYIVHVSNHINAPTDTHWLRVGLAAASIEDAQLDERDLFMSLGDLFVRAQRAGIDPVPYFQDVAAISAPHGRQVLSAFPDSAYLRSIRDA